MRAIFNHRVATANKLATSNSSFKLVNRFVSSDKKSAQETNSFVMNSFRGKLQLKELFPFPQVLSKERSEEMYNLVQPLEKFVETELDPALYDKTASFPDPIVQSLKELGAFGLQPSDEYGGVGLCNTEYARLVSIVGSRDLALCIFLGAHQSIGYKGILLFGTEAQKKKYLPQLTSGDKIAAFCLTETSAGSDAAGIKTKAVLSPDGKHYLISGTKIWVSNGPMADVMTVFTKIVTTDAAGAKQEKMTAFIVERAFGGVTDGVPENKMGIRGNATGTLYFDNTKVPVENVLGEIGDGFKVAVRILNQGRFGMAAGLSGTMQTLIKQTADHVATRKQFGHELCSYQSVQEKLTNMAMRHYVTESMAYMVSGIMDLGSTDFQLEAAISKIYASEAAWYCADEAIQLYGGMGFIVETGLERVMRDLRIFRIFEGANDVLRLFVGLTGIQFAGKHLQQALKSPAGMARFATDRILRSVGMGGKCAGQFSSHVPSELSLQGKLLGEAIDAFGGSVEGLLVKHKKGIIDEQSRVTRIADATIQVYAMGCALSRVSSTISKGLPTTNYEIKLVKAIVNQSALQVERLLQELSDTRSIENYEAVGEVSKTIVAAKGCVQASPLGF